MPRRYASRVSCESDFWIKGVANRSSNRRVVEAGSPACVEGCWRLKVPVAITELFIFTHLWLVTHCHCVIDVIDHQTAPVEQFRAEQVIWGSFGLATALGREFDVPLAVGNLAEQDMMAALVRGWATQDSSAIFKLQEERAGVEVRASDAPDNSD